MKLLEELEDERARELGERLVYLEQPEALPKPIRKRLDAWLKERILTEDPNVPWMTVPRALTEIERLSAVPRTAEEKRFLRDVKEFIRNISRRRSE